MGHSRSNNSEAPLFVVGLASFMHPVARPLLVSLFATALVTALAYALPDRHAATGVGLAFLAVTYVMVLRGNDDQVRHYGLALGGLLEPGPLSAKRTLLDGGKAIAWAASFAAVILPLFWMGFVLWWHPKHPFHFVAPKSVYDEILGQILVIALPEEAFYRGYLQQALDDALPGKIRVAKASIGWGLPITCAIFAAGHFLTEPNPQRLAVFFPAIVFGWLRARTGGLGASIAFHAMSNIFSASLGRGYGLFSG